MSTHGVDTSVLVLAISVLIGGLAIHVGSMFALKTKNLSHAVVTAVLGGLAWAIVSVLFGMVDIPGQLASIVGLVVWIAVVGWRYNVGWLRAGLIAIFAWLAALFVLAGLAALGIGGLEAFGVPGR